MLYGERNIKIDALKRWAKSLSISKEDPSYGLFKDQLDVFKDLISKLMPGDYWKNVLYSVSHYFMGYFLKRHNSAIRIANYYECFIAPVDIETHKKILAGYPPYTSTGEVVLRDNNEIIGSIGEKSDLLWSVFKDYFIVESQYGDVNHTLANHDEIMSIQLWNTENMTDSEISEYIDYILLQLALEKDLLFKRIHPSDFWKTYGAAQNYDIRINNETPESIPMTYLMSGVTCDSPRIAYLYFYQVLEYFFVRAQNRFLLREFERTKVLISSELDDNLLRQVLKDYTKALRERESLKLVLQEVVDIAKFKEFILADQDRTRQFTTDISIGKKTALNLQAADDKLISSLAERIYFFRCAIAHAKGDADMYMAIPEISDTIICGELPLLKKLSFKALQVWGR